MSELVVPYDAEAMRRIRERFGFFYVPSNVAREAFDVVLKNALGTGQVPSPIDIPLVGDAERVLDPGVLKIIDDNPVDRGLVAAVTLMPKHLKTLMDRAYGTANDAFLKDYNLSQCKKWMPICRFFEGERLGRDPTQEEWVDAYVRNGSIVDHKVYFVMRFPEKLRRIKDEIDDGFRGRILDAKTAA